MNLETLNLGLCWLIDILGAVFLVTLLLIGLCHGAWWLYKQVVGWKLISDAINHYRKHLQDPKPVASNEEIDRMMRQLGQLRQILWVILQSKGGSASISEKLLAMVTAEDIIRTEHDPQLGRLKIWIQPPGFWSSRPRPAVTGSDARVHPKEVDSERRLLDIPPP